MNQTSRIEQLRQKWSEESQSQSEAAKPANSTLYSTPFVKCSLSDAIIRRFNLNFKNGREISVPYSLLPLFELRPEGTLKISTNNFNIWIEGRNLYKVMDWLCKEVLISLSESKSGIDTASENEAYIDSIKVEGKAFE